MKIERRNMLLVVVLVMLTLFAMSNLVNIVIEAFDLGQ
tara:strand:- start:3973 stop:4086 length:114 start_codon:yes stop_codon:yes gene_type:complete